MRFLHVADTHVGYAALSRVDERGLNQREQDVFAAFSRAVDLAISERVDFVLHAGDLFDSVRPTNRAVTFVMEEVARCTKAGIPWFGIAGNHESPRLRETGSVLRFLDFVPGATGAYKGAAETHRVGDCTLHLLPHMQDSATLVAAAEAVEKAPTRWNVVAMHCGVNGVERFGSDEFNELSVPHGALRSDVDYVALGHYHRHLAVTKNAVYAGSTERTSVKEAHEPKGVVLVDLAEGTRRHVALATRRWIDLPLLDAATMSEIEVAPALERLLASTDMTGALVRVRVQNLPRAVAAGLDRARFRRFTEDALHVDWKVDLLDGTERVASTSAIGALPEEWSGFVAKAPLADREDVEKRGLAFLQEASG